MFRITMVLYGSARWHLSPVSICSTRDCSQTTWLTMPYEFSFEVSLRSTFSSIGVNETRQPFLERPFHVFTCELFHLVELDSVDENSRMRAGVTFAFQWCGMKRHECMCMGMTPIGEIDQKAQKLRGEKAGSD